MYMIQQFKKYCEDHIHFSISIRSSVHEFHALKSSIWIFIKNWFIE